MSERQYLTPAAVAAAAGVDPRTIRRACQAGEIPGAEQLDGRWVIPREAARRFLRQYRRYARKGSQS